MKKLLLIISILLFAGSPAVVSQELPDDFPTFHHMKTGETGEGWIFLAVSTDVEGIGYYVMMVDDEGTPFKYRKLEKDDYSYDFKVQPNGLTSFAQFLSHHDYTGGGNVIHMIMDEDMNFVDSFQMANGYIAEAHDFQLLPNGHSLIFGYYLTQMDLSDVVEGGYPNAMVSGGVVQELDADKHVVWQWRSWDHYDYKEYDFASLGTRAKRQTVSQFHLNTINLDYDNNILLATPSWTKKIDRKTGQILWHLGGWENEFTFIGVDSTEGVSDVTGHAFYLLENGNYLIYDNGPRRGEGTSEAHEYRIDQENLIAEKIMTFTPDTAIAAWHRGNAQRLPNGNTLVGWGGASGTHIPTCTEFDKDGNTVLKLWFDDPVTESYRAVRHPYPPTPRYEADIIEVGNGNSYELMQGDTLAIGVTVKIEDLLTVGYSELNFSSHNYAPRYPTFAERAPIVLPQRILMDAFSVNLVEGKISFQVDTFGITNPEEITIYQRAIDMDGNPVGDFVALTTTYNPVKGEVTAEFTDIGEFIFGYPDIAHGLYAPMTVYPEKGSRVNYLEPAYMEWSPQGFYRDFNLQLSEDPEFTKLLLDTAGMQHSIFDYPCQAVNDTIFWRVKATNDAGESPWSDTSFFTTRAPYIELTSPVGDEVWQRGLDHFIEWEDNVAGKVVLDLYFQDQLLGNIDTVASSGAYLWEIPFDLDSACAYHIRISSAADPAIHHVSPVSFSLNDSSCTNGPVMDVQLLSPNGGETFLQGDTMLIQWNNSTGDPLLVQLEQAGEAVEILHEGADNKELSWTIPAGFTPGDQFRIVISTAGDSPLADASNCDFSIGKKDITGIWKNGPSPQGFRLYPNPSTGLVYMEYSLDSGEEAEIRIFDALGAEKARIPIPAGHAGTGQLSHQMDGYPAGIYIVQLKSEQKLESALLRIQ